ncbi:MAG: type II toxin-antitoxin system HigB family toxin [Acetobacteraceae bacterium]|nr:type II toxin-antitoxin system HigB family toxin [Acetobacteraceae bacterium]
MRIVSRKRLREHWELPGRRLSEPALKTWYSIVDSARWTNLAEVKADFGAAVDLAHGKYVFNINGNDYRLVCAIDFVRHGVLVLWVGAHAEYDELNKRNGAELRRL